MKSAYLHICDSEPGLYEESVHAHMFKCAWMYMKSAYMCICDSVPG